MSRKLCKEKNLEHVWGRISSVYGPHDNNNTMLDYAIDCFLKGEVAHFSSSKQMWNYIYEDDAGEMFYHLGGDAVLPDTYFVANTESRPLKEYIETLMEAYGSGAKGVLRMMMEHACLGLMWI